MAHRFWGVNQGQHNTDVVEQASSPSKNVEINVDLAQNMSREDVLLCIQYIMMAIMKDNWPPA